MSKENVCRVCGEEAPSSLGAQRCCAGQAEASLGPWFRYPLHPDRFFVGDTAPSGTFRVVADLSPRPCVTGCGDETPSEAECLSKANLVAAAPELLAVAKLIIKEWEAPTEGVLPGELIARLSQYAAEARAAIAKAEGK